jgi:leucyl aminopeptidase
LGDYSFDQFRSKEHIKKNPHLAEVYIITSPSADDKVAVFKGEAAAEATILARDLVNIPGSHVYPETLAQQARAIEKKSQGKVKVQVLSEEECKKLGMGSFLSVGQGSDKKSAFIILHYKGTGEKKFTFIGKSITFDSGGLSLKPSEHMMDMKIDMAGGAAVLGVFDYLATAQPAITSFSDVYGILPAAENMISGSATRPGDVITAMNGKTIEVLNTDAEGRLVLADALVYAETVLKSDYIIDMATLTGACAVALGNDLAGVFTNEDALEKQFGSAAAKAGDDYWRMPLHEAYSSLIKSTIADIKNIGGGRYGGAITAALFLKEFVKKAKWMHIDIAGPAHSDKKGASGWGVLSVIYFLEQITNL